MLATIVGCAVFFGVPLLFFLTAGDPGIAARAFGIDRLENIDE